MARQFGGDLYDFPNMTDDEIRQVVVEQLREYPNLDADLIDVVVRDGLVTLSGRVGTDAEVQVATAVVGDVLGIERLSNELVVDEVQRGELSPAADEAIAQDEEVDEQTGEPPVDQSDTAAHLVEDLESQTYGTHDMGEAIQDGIPYIPPDRPVGDGYGSRENH